MRLFYDISFTIADAELAKGLKANFKNLSIKQYGDNYYISAGLDAENYNILFDYVKKNNPAKAEELIRGISYAYDQPEIDNADFTFISISKFRNTSFNYVFEIEGKKKTLSENSYSKKFDPERNTIFDLRFGFYEPPQMVGYSISKPLPDDIDIIMEETLLAGRICRKEIKEIVEANQLTGVKFLPVWLSSNADFGEPDYYLMKSTNAVYVDTIHKIRIDKQYPSANYLKLPAQDKVKLKDFNYLNLEGVKEVRLLSSKGTTSVNFISKKAMESLSEIKGLFFTAPVLFS